MGTADCMVWSLVVLDRNLDMMEWGKAAVEMAISGMGKAMGRAMVMEWAPVMNKARMELAMNRERVMGKRLVELAMDKEQVMGKKQVEKVDRRMVKMSKNRMMMGSRRTDQRLVVDLRRSDNCSMVLAFR